jgi:soluble lytic murein transglycosylase-like protein
MKISEFYKKFKAIKLTHDSITWSLLIIALIFMGCKINNLQQSIITLNNNQTLILSQVERNEHNISGVTKKTAKISNEVVDINGLINKYAKQFGVDPALAHSIAQVESGKKQNVKSSSGATGVYQLMPNTAKSLGVNPYNTEENIVGGIKYLAILQERYKDEDKVIASYNAGPSYIEKYGKIPPYKETKNYVQKVKSTKKQFTK